MCDKVPVRNVRKNLKIDQSGFAAYRLSRGIYEQGPEDGPTIDVGKRFRTGPFRVRHHPKDVAGPVTDTGDVPERPVWVGGDIDVTFFVTVPVDHLAVGLELVQGCVVRIIKAFAMGNGELEGPALIAGAAEPDVPGDELLVGVP